MQETAYASGPQELAVWHEQLPDDAHPGVIVGTFDILQPGNLATLRDAAERGTHLVVILEDDETAAAHSGPDRPYHPATQRAEFLCALRSVDAVAIASVETLGDYLNAIAPSTGVVCLEADGAFDERIAAHVEHVSFVPLVPEVRTRDIVNAIRSGETPVASPEVLTHPPHDKLREGEVSVTVNGCFDILHNGHLDLLQRAKDMGDHLTVLVNTDLSVQRYKGHDRPVFAFQFRRQALLELRCVDSVIGFDEDDPLSRLEELRPAIHVKGGSFDPERVAAETALLESWGGKLEFCPLLEGFSTSAIIEMAK